MSAQTMSAQPTEDAAARPVPWHRMIGVTWRQHRFALVAVVALLGALAVWLWIVGSSLHSAYAAAVACHPASSAVCQGDVQTFDAMDNFLSNGIILQVLPAAIGAFSGAPLLARELETGTFRFAWTQGFGRWRWALAKLVTLALVLTVAAELFGLLLSWYYQPYFAPGNQALGLTEMSPFNTGLFDLRGVAFAGWTLAAFSIGALAGMLIRRVVPAIAATLVAYAALAFAVGGFLREHYLTPLVTTNLNVPANAWVVSQWWTKGGTTLSPSAMRQVINATWLQTAPVVHNISQKYPAYLSVLTYLTHHGYTQWTRYQPGSRFWPFQWIEGGWLLALSILLLAATVWLVRRRPPDRQTVGSRWYSEATLVSGLVT